MGQWLLPRHQTHVRFVGRVSSEFPVVDFKMKIKGLDVIFADLGNAADLIL